MAGRPTWRDWAGLAGVCLAALVLYLLTLNAPLYRCDDIYFYIGARSLAAGKGLCDLSRPDLPLLTKYGPLPSALFAPFAGAPGEARQIRVVTAALLLLLTPVYYRFLRGRTSHFGALLTVALMLFNPITLAGLVLLSGGAAFTPLLAVTFLLLERRPPDGERETVAGALRRALPVALALGVGFYVHKMFLTAAAGAVAFVLLSWRRPRTAAFIAAGFLLAALPWMVRSHAATGHWISAEYEAEIEGRVSGDSDAAEAGVAATVRHALVNVKDVPFEIGHGMWPWSRGPGKVVWPALQRAGMGWTADLTLYAVFALVVYGALREWRARRAFAEFQLAPHTAMLLLFFVAFQYYAAFLPLLFLYLWRGFEAVTGRLLADPRRRRAVAVAGFTALMLPAVGKDFYMYVRHANAGVRERERRWAWVAEQTPEGEAVYWEGLSDYMWASWRWFDSGRPAAALKPSDVDRLLTGQLPEVRFVSVGAEGNGAKRLQAAGWQSVYTEPPGVAPPPGLIARIAPQITIAQREYLESLPPPQVLLKRPEPKP